MKKVGVVYEMLLERLSFQQYTDSETPNLRTSDGTLGPVQSTGKIQSQNSRSTIVIVIDGN